MRIKKLKIYSNNLEKQIEFYSKKLGLHLLDSTNNQATFQCGASILKIVKNDSFQPYHFAINIPCNKEKEALQWLEERVVILKDGNQKIQDFSFWNAKAIYFYDEDYNIVELIARKNLKNKSEHIFSKDSLLEISEIGLPVTNIELTLTDLKKITDIEIYSGDLKRFCAIGDEYGLFICINKHIKTWYPTGDKANSSEVEVKYEQNGAEYRFEFIGGKINTVTL